MAEWKPLPIGLNSRYLGIHTCGSCTSFEHCKKTKLVREHTDYCQWPPALRKFELATKTLICRDEKTINSGETDGVGAEQEEQQDYRKGDWEKFSFRKV